MSEAPKGKRATKKAATKERLLQVAKTAFQRDGYEAVSFRSLAREGCCSTGSFFSSWPDKRSLFTEAMGVDMDIPAFLERVAFTTSGYPGALGDLSEDALKMRRLLVGDGK